MRFFRHEKRPAWGSGRVLEEEGDRIRLLFEDGKERSLLLAAPGLVEVATKDVPKKSAARKVAPRETRDKLAKTRPARLIKSVRLAIRDGLDVLKAAGAFPDDTLVEMQKGLSRITADYARFAGTQPILVRETNAKSARKLHEEHGLRALFDELGSRLDCPHGAYANRTRAYESGQEAIAAMQDILGLLEKGDALDDRDIEEMVALLTPADLKDART